MGVDLSTYRTRIGRFSTRQKAKTMKGQRFHRLALFIQTCCPSAKILLLSLCVAQLLICAGDVETNPGPDKLDQTLKALKDTEESNKQYQKETTARLNEINTGINDISSRVNKLEETISKVTKLREDLAALKAETHEVKTEVNMISQRQREYEDLADDLNNRMRRNNVIIKGLAEQECESWSDSERIAKTFLSTNLHVSVGKIERAHRLGVKKAGFNRPIVVKFLNFKNKDEIIRNAYKLKDSALRGVWIEEDFSPNIQLIRKKLRDLAKLRFGVSKFRLYYD